MNQFKHFAPNPGELVIHQERGLPDTLDVEPWYADNEICLQALTFSVPGSEWNEFQTSQLYRDIVEYVEKCRKEHPEIPRTHIENCELVCKEENFPYFGSSKNSGVGEWLFFRVRRLFRKK